MDLNAKSITGEIARMKTEAVSSLLNPKANTGFDIAQLASGYINSQSGVAGLAATNAVPGLSAIGRNMSLPDPESAYKMMTEINRRSVEYKAQYATLSDMQAGVNQLGQSANLLGNLSEDSEFAAVKSQLQRFADQFNSWWREFDADSKDPELLGNTQAAQAARHVLQASIGSPFHGASQGLQGLAALGIEIDPVTKMTKLDLTKLEQVWTQQADKALAAIKDFSHHFSAAANLLSANGNFFQKQLSNLDRAIDYIQSNQTDLQAEFGLGDPPKLSDRLAKALEEYQKRQPVSA